MDTHRLKYFQRIAEVGSITRAADLLGIAQPALSRQLQLLEEDLGITLFRRTRRGVELTEAGERLRASTAAPLRQLELAMQYAGSPLARLGRNLRIGLVESAVDVAAAPLIATLSTVLPDAVFSVEVGSTDVLVEAMLKGTVDVALINPVPDERVFFRKVLSEDVVLAGSATSGLDESHPVAFADVVALPLVIPRSSSGIGTSLQHAALKARCTIDHRIATDSVFAATRLIEAGLCYGVLPRSACERAAEEGRMRMAPICEPKLTHTLGVAATAQLELPREVGVKLGTTIRGEVERLITTGAWNATLLAREPWNLSSFR